MQPQSERGMDVLSCILTNRIPPTKVMMSESGLPRENSDTVLSRVYVCSTHHEWHDAVDRW